MKISEFDKRLKALEVMMKEVVSLVSDLAEDVAQLEATRSAGSSKIDIIPNPFEEE